MNKLKQKVSKYKEKGGIKALPSNLLVDFKKNKFAYIASIPMVAFYIIFHYLPMFGIVIAFQRYSPFRGVLGSEWIGLDNFISFFTGPYFTRIFGNTLILGLLEVVIAFPAPIIFALLLNEIRQRKVLRSVQTISYMPYFISAVVLCGMVIDFSKAGGLFSNFVQIFTGTSRDLLSISAYFRPIYIIQNIWQGLGYGSIIFLAALTNVDQELYEAAVLDGAGRLKQTRHITIPGIMPTITILLILRIATILAVSTDKILLLYRPTTYEVSDVIGTYVYRVGILGTNYGLASAVGLFNSVVATALLLGANAVSRKHSDTSLF